MDLEKLTKELLHKKAEENNTIDLNAYAMGMADLKKQLALCNVVGRSEQLPKRLSNEAYKKAKTLRYEEFVEWWDSQV